MSISSTKALRPVLAVGNTKLGELFYSFSLPAIRTCPGASSACKALCYANRGHFKWGSVAETYQRNLKASRRPSFSRWMLEAIDRRQPSVVRIHVSGDFYDAKYARKWLEIVSERPQTNFLCYTRSWRDPEILPVLRLLAKQAQLHLWFSCDRETGAPPRIKQVRRAYMALDDQDSPRYKIDLAFRVRHKTRMKYDLQGALVCPYEQGVLRHQPVTCSKCKLCWTRMTPFPRKNPSSELMTIKNREESGIV